MTNNEAVIILSKAKPDLTNPGYAENEDVVNIANAIDLAITALTPASIVDQITPKETLGVGCIPLNRWWEISVKGKI
jgi:hypothetical protein